MVIDQGLSHPGERVKGVTYLLQPRVEGNPVVFVSLYEPEALTVLIDEAVFSADTGVVSFPARAQRAAAIS